MVQFVGFPRVLKSFIVIFVALAIIPPAAASPLPPTPPMNLDLDFVDSAYLLTWSPPLNSGGAPISGYEVYMVVVGAAPMLLDVLDPTDHDFLHQPQSSGMSNYYVQALNIFGSSLPSNPVSNYPRCEMVQTVGPPNYVEIGDLECIFPPPFP